MVSARTPIDSGGGAIVEQGANARIERSVGGHQFLERGAAARQQIAFPMERVEFPAEIPAFGLGFLPVLAGRGEGVDEGRLLAVDSRHAFRVRRRETSPPARVRG
jgi:hypothetical protein